MTKKDESITLPVQEFGRVVSYAPKQSEELSKEAEAIVKADADEFKKVMDCIRDIRWVKEPEVTLGPIVDKLQRFRPIGWHAYLASADYYVLNDYFAKIHACKKEHVPEKITFRYVLSTFRLWLESRKTDNYSEDWDD